MATNMFPRAVDESKVGQYPAGVHMGGGYFYDEVLEYRVWEGSPRGGDCYVPFVSYEAAASWSVGKPGAEPAVVLVLQREWIDEPVPGQFVPKKGERLAEWQPAWLQGNRRTAESISHFVAKHAN